MKKPICKICKGKIKSDSFYWTGKELVHKICFITEREKK